MMRSFSESLTVGDTSPVRVFSFVPSEFHSVIIRNDRSHADILYVGTGGVSVGHGFDLGPGEALAFTHLDFDVLRLAADRLVEIYGISGAGDTTARVFGFRGV